MKKIKEITGLGFHINMYVNGAELTIEIIFVKNGNSKTFSGTNPGEVNKQASAFLSTLGVKITQTGLQYA